MYKQQTKLRKICLKEANISAIDVERKKGGYRRYGIQQSFLIVKRTLRINGQTLLIEPKKKKKKL